MSRRKNFTEREFKLIDDVTLTAKAVANAIGSTPASIMTARVRRGIKTTGTSIRGKEAVLKLTAGEKAARTRRMNNEKNTNNTDEKIISKTSVKETKDFKFIINGVNLTVDGRLKNAHIGLDNIILNF